MLLLGEMGAGKTTFVRDFLGSRGFQGNVTSPTFTLIQEYILEPNIYHMDLYRLENELEIEQLDIQRYFQNDSCIIFVEWADKLLIQSDLKSSSCNNLIWVTHTFL